MGEVRLQKIYDCCNNCVTAAIAAVTILPESCNSAYLLHTENAWAAPFI